MTSTTYTGNMGKPHINFLPKIHDFDKREQSFRTENINWYLYLHKIKEKGIYLLFTLYRSYATTST